MKFDGVVVTIWMLLVLYLCDNLNFNSIFRGWNNNSSNNHNDSKYNHNTTNISSHTQKYIDSCDALIQPRNIQIRPVILSSSEEEEDLFTIRRLLLQEYMNPLSIRAEHLLVAYDVKDTSQLRKKNNNTCTDIRNSGIDAAVSSDRKSVV